MDADLQHPPELIGKMYEEFSKGYDIVLGKRESNEQNGVLRDKIGGLFYRLVSKISNVDLQANVADFGLFSKDVIEVVKQLPEHDRFLRGLMQWVGFKKTYINYKAGLRYTGKSKYSFKKLVNLGMSGITSFSAFPLRLSWWAGLLIFILSIFYSLYIIIDYFFISGRVVAGAAYTTGAATNLLFLFNDCGDAATSVSVLAGATASGYSTSDIIVGPRSTMWRSSSSSNAEIGYVYGSNVSVTHFVIVRADLFVSTSGKHIVGQQRSSGGSWSDIPGFSYNISDSSLLVGPRSQDMVVATSPTDLRGVAVFSQPLSGGNEAMMFSKLCAGSSFSFSVPPRAP
jgi:hypothetical protein